MTQDTENTHDNSKKSIIKVMVIDDSAVAREALSEIINSDPSLKVIATAQDPIFAVQKIKKIVPDVITLDVEMPRMDGITFLRKIMLQHPLPVVIISSITTEGSKAAILALEYGAAEIITKPEFSTKKFYTESKIRITDAIKAASKASLKKLKNSFVHTLFVEPKHSADVVIKLNKTTNVDINTEKIIVIGASTGGTQAIAKILTNLPINSPAIVIVQHMPEKFTASFANRLNSICKINVAEAKDADHVVPGQALIAPGNKHMLLKRIGEKYHIEIKDGPLVNRHRPSVDVLFRSAARYAGNNATGILLTGMGDDGAKGLLEMKDKGAFTIAQNEESSVVYGMPQAAVKINAAKISLDINKIPQYIINNIIENNTEQS